MKVLDNQAVVRIWNYKSKTLICFSYVQTCITVQRSEFLQVVAVFYYINININPKNQGTF